MSARSDPSMVVSDDAKNREKQVDSPMLVKYLANTPTLTEKLSSPHPRKETAKEVGDKIKAAKEFIEGWQALWEKKE